MSDAVAALHRQLVSVEVDGLGPELLMHAADEPGGKPPPRSSPEVSLLPILDTYLQGYHDRDRYVEPAHQRYVFDPKGNSTSVILVAGRAAGVWDLVEADEPERACSSSSDSPSQCARKRSASPRTPGRSSAVIRCRWSKSAR